VKAHEKLNNFVLGVTSVDLMEALEFGREVGAVDIWEERRVIIPSFVCHSSIPYLSLPSLS
jgi:hypothetical protein